MGMFGNNKGMALVTTLSLVMAGCAGTQDLTVHLDGQCLKEVKQDGKILSADFDRACGEHERQLAAEKVREAEKTAFLRLEMQRQNGMLDGLVTACAAQLASQNHRLSSCGILDKVLKTKDDPRIPEALKKMKTAGITPEQLSGVLEEAKKDRNCMMYDVETGGLGNCSVEP